MIFTFASMLCCTERARSAGLRMTEVDMGVHHEQTRTQARASVSDRSGSTRTCRASSESHTCTTMSRLHCSFSRTYSTALFSSDSASLCAKKTIGCSLIDAIWAAIASEMRLSARRARPRTCARARHTLHHTEYQFSEHHTT